MCKGPEVGGCLVFTERQGQHSRERMLGKQSDCGEKGDNGPSHTQLCRPLKDFGLYRETGCCRRAGTEQ